MQPDPLLGMIVFARMAPDEACEIARELHQYFGCGIGDMVMAGKFRTVWSGRIWANLGLRWLVMLAGAVPRKYGKAPGRAKRAQHGGSCGQERRTGGMRTKARCGWCDVVFRLLHGGMPRCCWPVECAYRYVCLLCRLALVVTTGIWPAWWVRVTGEGDQISGSDS